MLQVCVLVNEAIQLSPRSQALPSFPSLVVLQVTEGWVGPGNEANSTEQSCKNTPLYYVHMLRSCQPYVYSVEVLFSLMSR